MKLSLINIPWPTDALWDVPFNITTEVRKTVCFLYVRMLEERDNVVWIIMQYFWCKVQRRKTAYPAGYNKGHRWKVTGHTIQITGHASGAGVRALLTRLRTSLAMLLVSLESIPTSDKKKKH